MKGQGTALPRRLYPPAGDAFTWRGLGSRPGPRKMRARETAHAIGYVFAAELRLHGVDLSFTPVLDLDWGAARWSAHVPSTAIRRSLLHSPAS